MGTNQKCPDCGTRLTKVVMTKEVEQGGTLRRRHCTICEKRWYSYQEPEVVVPSHCVVWKGRRFPYIIKLDETRKTPPSG